MNKSPGKLNVIQAGIGNMGETWLKAVLASDEVDYAAFVETNDTVAAKMAATYDLDRALIFKTIDEALAQVRADGVIDVTPPRFHKNVSLTALDAGIPVLSEKPLSDSLDDALVIAERATQTGVLHMVAQNRRYYQGAQTVKQVLDSGTLGAVGAVQVRFFKGLHLGGFRATMPYPLIIDMAIHHFDMMRYFLDSEPVAIYGRSWNPAWSPFEGDASAAVTFEFANGVTVSYDGTWCASGHETSWQGDWRFDCERGTLAHENGDQVSIQRPTGIDGIFSTYDPVEPVPPVVMPRDGQAYLLHEFYEAVTAGTRPATTCQDNIHSLRMVFDVIQAFERGGVVRCHRCEKSQP